MKRKTSRGDLWNGGAPETCALAASFLLLVALVALLLEPQAGFSQPATPDTVRIDTIEGPVVCELKYRGVSRNVMTCITDIINLIADKHIAKMVDIMQGYVTVLGTLALAFYAFRLIFGAARIRGESVLLLIKFALVFYFATKEGLIEYRHVVLNASAWLGNTVMILLLAFTEQEKIGEAIITELANLPIFSVKIDPSILSGNNLQTFFFIGAPELILNPIVFPIIMEIVTDMPYLGAKHFIHSPTIFDALDRTFQSVWGLHGGIVGAAWLFVGTFFGGPIGAAIGIFMLSIWISLMVACAQAVFISAMTIVGLTFLFAMGPVFIPLALFPATKGIFQNWIGWIISLAIQRFVLGAFLAMTLFALDWMFVKPLDTIYKEAKATMTAPDSKKTVTLFSGMFRGASDKASESTSVPVFGANYFAWGEGSDYQAGQFPVPERHMLLSPGDMGNLPTMGWRLGLDGNPQPLDQIAGAMSSDISAPYLDWDANKLRKVIGTLAPGLVMLLLMISFMKMLPKWISDLVGNRQVASFAQFGEPIQKVGDHVVELAKKGSKWYER